MPGSEHLRRDAGSRGFLDVLRHPIASLTMAFRDGAPATDGDRAAAVSSAGISVSCFLRSSFGPFPERWKQGELHLDAGGVSWAPGIRFEHDEWTPLPALRVIGVREVERPEYLQLKRRIFQVIETTSDQGDLQLGVPRDSVALVVERLTASR